MPIPTLRAAALVLLAAAFAAPAAPAQVITSVWTGGTGFWSDPALWSPAVPNNGTPPGATYDAVLNGAGTLTLDAPVHVQQLAFQAGTVVVGHPLAAHAGVVFSGSAPKTLVRGTTTMGGPASAWTGGEVRLATNATLTNAAGSTFAVSTPGAMTAPAGAPSGRLVNDGVVQRRDAGGETTLAVPFVNNAGGQLSILEGTLALAGGGSSAGQVSVARGAALRVGGNYAFTGGAVSADGTVAFSGGTGTVAAPYDAGVTVVNGGTARFDAAATTADLMLTSGATAGTGMLDVNGTFVWTGGQLGGRVNAYGTAQLTPAAAELALAGQLAVNGSGAFTAGILRMLPGSALAVNGTLTFDGADSVAPAGMIPGPLTNAGTVRKLSANTTTVAVPFDNAGALHVEAGRLRLTGGGTHTTGVVTVNPGAVLEYAGNYQALNVGTPRIHSGGEVHFTAGTVRVDVPYYAVRTRIAGGRAEFNNSVNMELATLSAGAWGGVAAVTVPGAFTWEGGAIDRPGAYGPLTASGGVQITGAGPEPPALRAGQLVTRSWSAWTGGALRIEPGATLNNMGGLASAGGFTAAVNGTATGGGTFINAGLFRRQDAGGETVLNVVLNNTGAVQVNEGTLALTGGGSATGSFAVAAPAALRFGGDYALSAGSSVTGPGTVAFSGGTVTVAGSYVAPPTVINGGTVLMNASNRLGATLMSAGTLGGTATFSIGGPFTWAGGRIVGPGSLSAGTATFTGAAGALALSNRTFNVFGPTNWTGGDLQLEQGATILFGANGSLTAPTGDARVWNPVGARGTFTTQGPFTKSGAGTLTFDTGVTYRNQGTLRVQGGTVAVRDGLQNTGAVELSAAGRIDGDANLTSGVLRGNGAITGTTTTASGVFIFPLVPGGSRFATLRSGAWVLNGGTRLTMDLGSATPRPGAAPSDVNLNDRLAADTDITFATNSANLVLTVDGTGLTFEHRLTYDWFLASYGTLTGFDPAQVTITPTNFSGGGSFAWQSAGNSLVLSFTAAPEPGALLLTAFAAAVGVLWRRRNSLAGRTSNP